MVSQRQLVIALIGPTATGKSALAEALARQLDGHIISADSMQVYRGMDIGTAKTPLQERTVPYACIDMVNPNEKFSAFEYQQAARSAFDAAHSAGKQPILCGGTGLYVRAALEEFVAQPNSEASSSDQAEAACTQPNNEERRKRLNEEALKLGPQAFHDKLAQMDPASAALIHPNNTRRVVRAFEWLEDGSSYAQQAAGFDEHKLIYPTVLIGLDMPREYLYERINKRVDTMIALGLVDEVQRLLDEGYEEAITAQQAIGYKEIVPVLRGQASLDEAVNAIKQATRHYAKRQKAWFRRDKRIVWLDAQSPQSTLLKLVHETIEHATLEPSHSACELPSYDREAE